MLIPIGHDKTTVRRWPWVTGAIVVVNLVAFALTFPQMVKVEARANEKLVAVEEYWGQRPHLKLPDQLLNQVMTREQAESFKEKQAEAMRRGLIGDPIQERLQQPKLDVLVGEYLEVRSHDPLLRWGLVPAAMRPVTLLTSMFLHVGVLHLIGNLVMLLLAGPAVEDAFGRPLFAGLYLVCGVGAALAHAGSVPGSLVPMVGASGAIAGVMGMFLVRFFKARIRFVALILWAPVPVTLPAWGILPIWFLQQYLQASFASEARGVAYTAHVAGFLLGCAAAVVVKVLAVEERIVSPKVEAATTASQHPALDRGLDLLRVDPASAREWLAQVLVDEPRHPDAHLGMWQCYVDEGYPELGVPHILAVIEDEVRRGEHPLALTHWKEMLEAAGATGSVALRWRLASRASQETEVKILRTLVSDPEGGAVAIKAAARLAELAGTPPEVAQGSAPVADGGTRVPTVVDRTSTGSEAAAGGVTEVREAVPRGLDGSSLYVRYAVGSTGVIRLAEIVGVAAFGISDGGRPRLVLDVVVTPREHQGNAEVVRFDGRQFEPRQVVGSSDISPRAAFDQLVAALLQGTSERRISEAGGHHSSRYSIYPSLATYQALVLDPWLEKAHLPPASPGAAEESSPGTDRLGA